MKLFLSLAFALPLLATTNPSKEIAQKLAKLAKEMQYVHHDLNIQYDPFSPDTPIKHRVKPKKIKSFKQTELELSMIFNKKAFINGKWVKENQKIADYVVRKIDKDTVFLSKGRKVVKLSITKKNSILIAKEE